MLKRNELRTQLQEVTASLKDMPRVPKVILIGERGAGKTSVLNLLCGLSLVADSRIENKTILEFKKKHAQVVTRPTSGCGAHLVTIDRCSLKVIDTPGFEEADDPNAGEDKTHSQMLSEALEQCDYLHAVVLVINGTVTREQPSLKRSLLRVTESFPSRMLQKVVVVFVNVERRQQLAFPLDSLRQALGESLEEERTIYLDNPLARLEALTEGELQRQLEQEDDEDGKAKEIKREINMAVKSCTRLLTIIGKEEPLSPNPARRFTSVGGLAKNPAILLLVFAVLLAGIGGLCFFAHRTNSYSDGDGVPPDGRPAGRVGDSDGNVATPDGGPAGRDGDSHGNAVPPHTNSSNSTNSTNDEAVPTSEKFLSVAAHAQ